MALSIEEKYDEVRQLISIGKEKGYLLYDEVNELLPADITSSDELDDLFSTFGSAGIEVVDSEKNYREDKLLDRTGEGAEELELDLTPGALDKTNDPVRMYLREMGTVPLLTREGEVEIAKRIERGKLAVIKSISRTPTIARADHPDGRRAQERRAQHPRAGHLRRRRADRREDRRPQEARSCGRSRRCARPGRRSRSARRSSTRRRKGATTKRQAQVPASVRWEALRARVELSQLIRKIEFTETIKRRMIDQIKESVEAVMRRQARDRLHRAAAESEEQAEPKLKEDEQEEPPQAAEGAQGPGQDDGRRARGDAGAADAHARDHLARRDRRPNRRRRSWSRPTCGWSSRSPRSTPTAACSSST